MIKTLLAPFVTPSAERLAMKELEEAKRELLVAVRNAEYYAAMVRFQQARIARLGQVIPQVTK